MDKNSFGKKGLVVAVILLFLGMSIIPSTATAIMVEKKSTMMTPFSDDDTLYVGEIGRASCRERV